MTQDPRPDEGRGSEAKGKDAERRALYAAAVSLYSYESVAFFDIATQKPDGAGHLIRAGGFAARIDHLQRVIRELQRAQEKARELGLIGAESAE